MADNGVNLFDFQIISSYTPPKTESGVQNQRRTPHGQGPGGAYNVDISPEARELRSQYEGEKRELKQEYLKEKKALETEHSKKQKQALAEYKRIQREIDAEYDRNRMKLKNMV
jgi:hypothetical protein